MHDVIPACYSKFIELPENKLSVSIKAIAYDKQMKKCCSKLNVLQFHRSAQFEFKVIKLGRIKLNYIKNLL